MFLEPEQGGFTEAEPSPSVREGGGHIPLPGKRHFPIGVPSKEVCDVGRSAQAVAGRLRNAGGHENAALPRAQPSELPP